MKLSSSEQLRYARHITLPEVGEEGQLKLKAASVAVVGAGGLGSPSLLYLAAAGVGRIGIIDFDDVDISNLQRQVLYSTDDLRNSKAASARKKLASINPEIDIVSHEVRLNADNVIETLGSYDLVLDGTDNFATRFLINDACVILKKPNVYGSIYRFEGQVSVFCSDEGPCYRCLFPEPPDADAVPNCAEGGVLGVLAGVVGALQATEAIKLILRKGTPLVGKLLLYNALDMDFSTLLIERKSNCPVCGDNPTIKKPQDLDEFCPEGPGESSINEIEASRLETMIEARTPIRILDVRNEDELKSGIIPGSLHIPLADLEKRKSELDRESEIIVYCRSGARSARAIQLLQAHGFSRLKNLKGGILAWKAEGK